MSHAVRLGAPNLPRPDAVRDQLVRLEASKAFHGSSRLTAFLRFVVNETLGGSGALLKEVIVGQAIYPRDPPYDPVIDSVVRVEARRLRRKLDEYYLGAGASDPVVVTIPSGSYTPVFALNACDAVAEGAAASDQFKDSVRLMILPVLSVSEDPLISDFADTFADELITELETRAGFMVVPRAIAFGLRGRNQCLVTLAGDLGLDAMLHGVVRATKAGLCLTMELADVHGFLLASERLERAEDLYGGAALMCRELARGLCDTGKATGLNHGLRKLRSAKSRRGALASAAHLLKRLG
ncbi:MAG: hypothetical protein ACRYG4_13230 [Janthinobacterium lividum]